MFLIKVFLINHTACTADIRIICRKVLFLQYTITLFYTTHCRISLSGPSLIWPKFDLSAENGHICRKWAYLQDNYVSMHWQKLSNFAEIVSVTCSYCVTFFLDFCQKKRISSHNWSRSVPSILVFFALNLMLTAMIFDFWSREQKVNDPLQFCCISYNLGADHFRILRRILKAKCSFFLLVKCALLAMAW